MSELTTAASKTLRLTTNDISYYPEVEDNERICYIHVDTMKDGDLSEGDFVEITGWRSTIAKCYAWPSPHGRLETRTSIGLITISLECAGASIFGDKVFVKKIKPPFAAEIELSPITSLDDEGVQILDRAAIFPLSFAGSGLIKGNYVTLVLSMQPEEPKVKLHFQVMKLVHNNIEAGFIGISSVFRVLVRNQPEIKEKINQRFIFLNELYNQTGGLERKSIDAVSLGVRLGFDITLVEDVLEYLGHENLIKTKIIRSSNDSPFVTYWIISITHKGKKEIEAAHTFPTRHTTHFPKHIINVIQVYNMSFKGVVHDQSFNNINNSNIINESQVDDTILITKGKFGNQASIAVQALKEVVLKSPDSYASTIFNQFTEEIKKPKPNKSILSKLLSKLEALGPAISTFSGAVEAISFLKSIFS